MRGVRRRIVVAATVGVALLGVFGAVVALVDGRSGDTRRGHVLGRIADDRARAGDRHGRGAGRGGRDERRRRPRQEPGTTTFTRRSARHSASGLAAATSCAPPSSPWRSPTPPPPPAACAPRSRRRAGSSPRSRSTAPAPGWWCGCPRPAWTGSSTTSPRPAPCSAGRAGRRTRPSRSSTSTAASPRQQASVTRVRALLAQATSIGDIVSVESELARREADLDSLQRRLADPQGPGRAVDADRRAADREHSGSRGSAGFGAGLGAGWSGLKVIGSGLATAAGFLLPFLPLLAVAGAVVWAVRRRAGRRRGGPGPEGGI